MYRYNRVPEGPSLTRIIGAMGPYPRWHDASAAMEEIFCEDMGFHAFEQFHSGRQALARALRLAGGKGGVLVPAYGCPIVVEVVRALGMEPLFIDIEARRFCMATTEVDVGTASRAVAAVVVHEFGNPVPPGYFDALRRRFSRMIIEDCAIALGARDEDGEAPGRRGDLAIFSGSLGKPVGAAAWGGLGIRGERVPVAAPPAPRAGSLSSLAYLMAGKVLAMTGVYDLARPFVSRAVAGDSVAADVGWRRPSTLDVRIVLGQLKRLEAVAAERWKVTRGICRVLEEAGMALPELGEAVPMVGRIPFYVPRGMDRRAIMEAFRGAGIELSVPYQRNFAAADAGHFPVAAEALKRLVCLTYRTGMGSPAFESRLRGALECVWAEAG